MSSILKVDTIQTAAGGTPTAADLGLNVSGSVLQVLRFKAPVTEASVANIGNSDQPTTSNTTSLWTATITPKASTSKIVGIYQSQEDGQGTNGSTVHACFVGSTYISSSQRYLRYSSDEPYTQSYTFEYDHNTTSAVTFDMRYGSGAALLIRLNKSGNNAVNGPLQNATSLILMEIAG